MKAGRIRRSYRVNDCTCEMCGLEFKAARAHKKTCSVKCRKQQSRWVKKLEAEEAARKKKKSSRKKKTKV